MLASTRSLVTVAVAALAVGLPLAGCGDSDEASGGSASGSNASSAPADAGLAKAQEAVEQYTATQPPLEIPKLPERPKPGVGVGFVGCTIPVCHAEGYADAAKALGWKLDYAAFDLAPEPFVAAWGKLLQKTPDVMGFAGVFPHALIQKQLDKVAQSDIPVVSVTTGEKEPVAGAVKACFTCAPQFEMTGKLMADFVVADAEGKPNVVFVDDPAIKALDPVWNGFSKELDAVSPDAKVDTLEINGQAPPTKNASAVVSHLQRHPDVQYLVFVGDQYVAGVPEAIAAAGLADKVKVVGRSPQAANMEYIRDGGEYASVAEESVESTWRAIDALARLQQGVELTDPQPVGWHQIITKDNVDTIEGRIPIANGFPEAFLEAWHVEG